MPPTTVDAWWIKARNALGAPTVEMHSQRHFDASRMIAGCDVVTVQRAMGHACASVTLNTHSHLWPNAEDRTRRAVDGLQSAALPSPCGLSAD